MALLAKRQNQTNAPTRTHWDPFEVIQEMMRFDPTRASSPFWGDAEFIPTFDVKETKDGYVFKGDLPGMKENDVEVSLNGNRLTISGTRESERSDEGEQYYAHERSYGSFLRTFTLPDDVDAEKVDAEFENGVLAVRIAKKAAAQPKKIQVGRKEVQTRQLGGGKGAENAPMTVQPPAGKEKEMGAKA